MQALLVCGVLARLAVLVRIWQLRAWCFFFFGVFVFVGVSLSCTSFFIKFTGPNYYPFWRISETSLLLASIATGIEAYIVSARRFWRVGILQPIVIMAGIGLGAMTGYAALLAISDFIHGAASQSALLAAKLFASLSLAIFVTVTSILFSLQPTKETRNGIIHRWIVVGYFVLDAALKGLVLGGLKPAVASYLGLSLSVICLILWTILMSKDGQDAGNKPTATEADYAVRVLELANGQIRG